MKGAILYRHARSISAISASVSARRLLCMQRPRELATILLIWESFTL